jgi:pimeloyl-ACP methyl ester carboxylesterase
VPALPSRVRRGLIAATAVVTFIVLAGATYQGIATAIERRQFRHPGRLIDVGGHQLHIYCLGEGTPTVVLEAPAAGMSAAWGWVQPQLARRTRVCAYDRAGLGWSEAGDRPFDSGRVPDELRALLKGARERGPFILVGEGLGAAYAETFATRYPNDVAALVLIDPPDPGAPVRSRTQQLVAAAPWLARTGLLRATQSLAREAEGLPADSEGAMRAFLNRPDHLTRMGREIAQWDRTMALAGDQMPARLPVTRVAAAGSSPTALLNRKDAAARATASILEAITRVRSH